MKREDLGELHYIALICDVPSMCRLGILSHRAARSVKHGSIALADVQNLRRSVLIPGGGRLHDYANLYICARNPMLFRRKGRHRELAVLRLTPDVLDIDGTIVSDGNAASKYVRFSPSPAGLSRVDYERVSRSTGLILTTRSTSGDISQQSALRSLSPARLVRGSSLALTFPVTRQGRL